MTNFQRNNTKNTSGGTWVLLFQFVLYVGVLCTIPFGIIFALNELFLLGIPYQFSTWFAVVFLELTVFSRNVRVTNLDDIVVGLIKKDQSK